MQTNHEGQRPNTVPGWVKLGAAGAITLALTQLAPAGPHSIPVVAGLLMVLVSIIWGRQWVAELVRAVGRPPQSRR